MQLCTNSDIAILEPAVFTESGFNHLKVLRALSGSVNGTAVSMPPGTLGAVTPGMIALLGTPAQVVEILSVPSSSQFTISVLRADRTAAAVAPGISGSVEVNVLSFSPVIQYASDELLESLGAADKATDHYILVRQAVVARTLSLLYMSLVQGADSGSESTINTANKNRTDLWRAKSESYHNQWETLKNQLSLHIDRNGDGTPETPVRGNVAELWRA